MSAAVPESLPTCRQVVELVTDYLEGEMSLEERARFEQHLAGCEGCRAYLEQMRETIELTGRLDQESLPEETREELVLAFRRWFAA